MTITILDFTAAWCAPCRAMTPLLDSLSTEYGDRLCVQAIDVDHEPVLAQQYGVRSMPTLVVLAGGREVGRVVGLRPRRFIAGVIDRALAGETQIAAP
jgi:thioredoxin 1